MYVSQSTLALLCGVSFLLGFLLGLICDLIYASRLWFVPLCRRYHLQAIQTLQQKWIGKRSLNKENVSLSYATQIVGDIFFCLIFSLAHILLFYRYTNGVFRISALLCTVAGFLLWRTLLLRPMRKLLEWCAFMIEVLLRYLFRILLYPMRCFGRFLKHLLRKHRQKRLREQRKHYTNARIKALKTFEPFEMTENKREVQKKGDHRARKIKKAV